MNNGKLFTFLSVENGHSQRGFAHTKSTKKILLCAALLKANQNKEIISFCP